MQTSHRTNHNSRRHQSAHENRRRERQHLRSADIPVGQRIRRALADKNVGAPKWAAATLAVLLTVVGLFCGVQPALAGDPPPVLFGKQNQTPVSVLPFIPSNPTQVATWTPSPDQAGFGRVMDVAPIDLDTYVVAFENGVLGIGHAGYYQPSEFRGIGGNLIALSCGYGVDFFGQGPVDLFAVSGTLGNANQVIGLQYNSATKTFTQVGSMNVPSAFQSTLYGLGFDPVNRQLLYQLSDSSVKREDGSVYWSSSGPGFEFHLARLPYRSVILTAASAVEVDAQGDVLGDKTILSILDAGILPGGYAFNGDEGLVVGDSSDGYAGQICYYTGFGELNPKLAFTVNPQSPSGVYGLQIRPLAGPGGPHVELAFSIQVAYGTILRASTNLLNAGKTFNALFPDYQITETADQYRVTLPALSQPCFFRLLPPNP